MYLPIYVFPDIEQNDTFYNKKSTTCQYVLTIVSWNIHEIKKSYYSRDEYGILKIKTTLRLSNGTEHVMKNLKTRTGASKVANRSVKG